MEVIEQSPSGRGHYAARIRHYASLFGRSLHLRLFLANLLCFPLPTFVGGAVRGRVYRWAGFAIGEGACIMGALELTSAFPDFYDKLAVGEGVVIADHVTINLDAKVTLGKNVAVSPKVLIYTGSHKVGPGSMRLGEVVGLPVTIEDGAWIRFGALIAPGVTIGRGSVVAAGAVVLKDVPPHTYVEGNPAVVKGRLPWPDR